MVQTGAKTQLGGLKLGFLISGYQVVMLDWVTLLDKKPTAKQMATQYIILRYLFIFSILYAN
jgi:hypothetical protein